MTECNDDYIYNDNIKTIECLNDYLIEINNMRSHILKEQGEETDNQHFFFRGQANVDWDIIPGIFRGNLLSYEADLVQLAFLRNPSDFKLLGSNFEKLAKLQHYGLPTRLLDVTSNPLVALYFACQTHKEFIMSEEYGKEYAEETDGAVFFQRAYCKGYDELEIKVISHVACTQLLGKTLEDLLIDLVDEGIYTEGAALKCRDNKYRSLIEVLQNDYFVISNLNNERLIRQSGAFLVCGHYNVILDEKQIGKSVLQKANGGLKSQFDGFYFHIPAEKKKEILDELDFYNINEGSLFPELEHQMTYIKNAQSVKTSQTIGTFIKVESEVDEIAPNIVKNMDCSSEQIKNVVDEVTEHMLEPSLRQKCVEILDNNMTIDWFHKEHVQSKMRLELTKFLETTAQYNRKTAKTKAQDIVSEIIQRLV